MVFSREIFACVDEIFSKFDAEEVGIVLDRSKVEREGEGEVGFARAKVHDAQRGSGFRKIPSKGFEAFDEAADLTDFVSHGGGWIPRLWGQAEVVEDGMSEDRARLGGLRTIVFGWGDGSE